MPGGGADTPGMPVAPDAGHPRQDPDPVGASGAWLAGVQDELAGCGLAGTSVPGTLAEVDAPAVLHGARTAVWGLHGVLADDAATEALSYELVLERYGERPGPGWFTRLSGYGEEQVWAWLRARHRLPDEDALATARFDTWCQLVEFLRPTWWVGPLLLCADEHVLVTTASARQVRTLLDLWGLTGRFTVDPSPGPWHLGGDEAGLGRRWARACAGADLVVAACPDQLAAARCFGAVDVGCRHSSSTLTTAQAGVLVDVTRPGRWIGGHPTPRRWVAKGS